jgi:signal peptidase I
MKKKIIITLLIVALLGINLHNIGTQDTLPMPFGYGLAVVLSNSMAPTLMIDDLVLIHKTDNITVGDIIVYQNGYELIIHRVVGYDGQTVTTQGDANNVADPSFDSSNVKGRMIARIPYVGRLVTAIKTPSVLLTMLAAIFLITEALNRKSRQ